MRRNASVFAVVALIAACSEPLRAPTAPQAQLDVAASGATSYVVVFKGQGLPKDFARVVADAGGAVSATIPEIGALMATTSDPDFATKLATSNSVQAVSPNVELQMIPANAELAMTAQADASGAEQGPVEPPGPDPQPGMDPLYNQQWDKMRMNASATGSYAVQRGRKEVTVAILDTGAEITHPDIIPNLDVARSRSFIPSEPSIDDQNGHGSWCASAVGAPINGIGISGVAPNVTLVALKVLNRAGRGNFFALAQALVYAGQQKFDVASMSLSGILRHADGYQALTHIMQRAVNFARQNGVTPLAALGNDLYDLSDGNFWKDLFVYPAEIDGVIGVAATGYRNRRSWYSNYGMGKTDVSAPGGANAFQQPPPTYRGRGNVLGAWAPENIGAIAPAMRYEECTPDNGCYYYAWIQGTSMATPNAAGVAALIVSQYGDFTPDNSRKAHMSPQAVEAILQRTANNQPCPEPNSQTVTLIYGDGHTETITTTCKGEAGGYTNYFGKGIVDAFKAVTQGPGSGAAVASQ